MTATPNPKVQRVAVQCVGHPSADPIDHPIEECSICINDGCGWKGKRKYDQDYYGPYGMEPAPEVDPCPRCGGQVKIP
jgi:hypothetical protein